MNSSRRIDVARAARIEVEIGGQHMTLLAAWEAGLVSDETARCVLDENENEEQPSAPRTTRAARGYTKKAG